MDAEPGAAFVGRDEEKRLLRASYEAARQGPARYMLVEGPAGNGKTALLRRLLDSLGDAQVLGKPDVVAGSSASNVVSVLLNNGDGTFRAAPNPPSALLPFTPDVGDFAQRGVLDLAVGEVGASQVSVRPGHGDGTFGAATTYPVGLDPWWVTATDFLHNGKVDLLVGNGLSGSISVLLGNGDGSFQPAVTY